MKRRPTPKPWGVLRTLPELFQTVELVLSSVTDRVIDRVTPSPGANKLRAEAGLDPAEPVPEGPVFPRR